MEVYKLSGLINKEKIIDEKKKNNSKFTIYNIFKEKRKIYEKLIEELESIGIKIKTETEKINELETAINGKGFFILSELDEKKIEKLENKIIPKYRYKYDISISFSKSKMENRDVVYCVLDIGYSFLKCMIEYREY